MLVVVTSLFGPAEYGEYAVVMSYVGIVSSIACFRYELGIVSARSHVAAANIALASAAIAVVVALLGYWFVVALIHWLGSRMTLGGSPVIVALLVFLKALDQIAGSILYRREAYFQFSVLKFVQAVILLVGFTSPVSPAPQHRGCCSRRWCRTLHSPWADLSWPRDTDHSGE